MPACTAPHAAAAPHGPPSPDRRSSGRPRPKAAPKLNPDGSVRLNARQRRTLRRAQERAMKALLEAQTRVHGISAEQVCVVVGGAAAMATQPKGCVWEWVNLDARAVFQSKAAG